MVLDFFLVEKNGGANGTIRAGIVLLGSCCVLVLMIDDGMGSFDPNGS